MSNQVLRHTREGIDAEILVLQERIRSLRSSRNALSLVHCLPPEVMVQVFTWVQILCHEVGPWGDIDPSILPKWIRVTHVFQHWRNIALSSQALYSTVLSHNLRYFKGALELAGSAPLSLIDSVDFQRENDAIKWDNKELQELVVSILPRVRSLWLEEPSAKFLHPLLKKSDLNLEQLTVSYWRTLSRSMFPRSLRYLRLHIYHPKLRFSHWLSGLSNMVELTLDLDHDSKSAMAIDILSSVLDGMPRLISLELGFMLKPTSVQADRAAPITPKLQNLSLNDDPDHIAEFLPWLSFASRFTIELKPFTLRVNNGMDWSSFFEQLGQVFRPLSAALRVVEVAWKENWRQRDAEILFHERAGESPCLRIFGPVIDKRRFDAWLKAAGALPRGLGHIESLTMDTPVELAGWRDSPWHGIGTLRQLTLCNAQISFAYLEYLTALEAEGDRSGESVSFASLEELSLHGIHYDHDLETKVQAALVKRMGRGVKLRKLGLYDCNISQDSVLQLSKVVDLVEHSVKKAAEGI
ncbi:hypothetical protein BDN72DRAFT_856522 [Pluteus cervinus]|uniref:Uncharacterized protein n=1 Tax=Pluteus cervinus TaxID=181527 RepID=A0ACD3B045_9AGAR|nr:hypothetical protein BDN72DRAFT_856522 [Pluteus cervinus]